VLHHHRRRGIELLRQRQGGVEVEEVVERDLLPLEDEGGGERGALVGEAVEGRRLVRVLAVAQGAHPLRVDREVAGESLGAPVAGAGREPCGDHAVVAGGVGEGLDREIVAPRLVGSAGGERLEHRRVVGGLADHGHVPPVLGGGAQQRRAADVDLLDRLGERAPGARRGDRERVEVHGDDVDGDDSVAGEDLEVVGDVAAGEDAAVDGGVQGLHPTAEDLGEAGGFGDLAHRHARLPQHPRGVAGGEDLEPQGGQAPGEGRGAGLVGDREERAARGVHGDLLAGF
jgi:hypothetical protein